MHHDLFDSKNDMRLCIVVNYFHFNSELILKGKNTIFSSALCKDCKSISQDISQYCDKGVVCQYEIFKKYLFTIFKVFLSSEGMNLIFFSIHIDTFF